MFPVAKACLTLVVVLLVSHVPSGEYYRLSQHHNRQNGGGIPMSSSSRRRLSNLRRHSVDSSAESLGSGGQMLGVVNGPDGEVEQPVSVSAAPTRLFNPPRSVTECPTTCQLNVVDLADIRSSFLDAVDDDGAKLVRFKVQLVDHVLPVLETYPYMDNSYRASEWVWASERHGRRLLALPLDADVLSMYALTHDRKYIELHVESSPVNCLVGLSPECRLNAVRRLLILNVTRSDRHTSQRDFLCHYVINATTSAAEGYNRLFRLGLDASSFSSSYSRLVYRCCETADFRSGDDVTCRLYVGAARDDIRPVLVIIDVLAIIVTLFSPVIVLRIKMALRFDATTKFFRASLKHGITGQRNYVIRISSRQLINLGDRQPFSIPRTVFRLICHGYGEGRCCIHWWSAWEHQPTGCQHRSCCRRCWLGLARTVGVLFAYPVILYIAVGLYLPRLPVYHDLVKHTRDSETYGPISLDVNLIGAALTPPYDLGVSVWLLFSFCAFMYSMVVLSSPNNPLERCLLRYDGKRPAEQPGVLYDRMTRGYKSMLHRLAYGEYPTKRHFFRIPWVPWGVRRVVKFVVRTLSLIPVVHVCFTTFMFDAKIFDAESVEQRRQQHADDLDEATDPIPRPKMPSARLAGRWCLVTVVWFGFALMLGGYCTAVFLMVEFALNVVLFLTLAVVLNSSTLLPWMAATGLIAFYINDSLSKINEEHRHVLRLIDENSPRISAVEEPEIGAPRGGGGGGGSTTSSATAAQTLRTHNLGAVKFIDSDNTEYVSKELYYNVCTDLKCGWSNTIRRLAVRTAMIVAYIVFLFSSLSTVDTFVVGSEWIIIILGCIGGLAPKLASTYAAVRSHHPETDRRAIWSRVIPDVLDRHIRVDRTGCLDDAEQVLSTYDVRPIGLVEMELPRVSVYRTLRLWKFPWIVSGDQQTPSHDPVVIALGNKLAAATFLGRAVTRQYPPELHRDPSALRQWCLLVESSILEAATTAGTVNGAPLDSVPLFSRDVLPLVVTVDAGTTIDSVVDCINREFYTPYTRGVLVTIANTPVAVYKLDGQILVFNSSCHGDQVTDLFGAVLVTADFNTQNLQAAVKYVIDPYRPDAVPVYTVIPVEAYVFRSPEILEVESVV